MSNRIFKVDVQVKGEYMYVLVEFPTHLDKHHPLVQTVREVVDALPYDERPYQIDFLEDQILCLRYTDWGRGQLVKRKLTQTLSEQEKTTLIQLMARNAKLDSQNIARAKETARLEAKLEAMQRTIDGLKRHVANLEDRIEELEAKVFG